MAAIGERQPTLPSSPEKKQRGRRFSGKTVVIALCATCFLIGFLFEGLISPPLSANSRRRFSAAPIRRLEEKKTNVSRDIIAEVSKTHLVIQSLDKTISSLEMELAVERMRKMAASGSGGGELSSEKKLPKKVFMVIGINTGFNSKPRRDAVRATWMPKGEKRRQLETMGVVIRFVIGRSSSGGGALDRAIDDEDSETNDFLRLDHVEGYHQLSSKTRLYFSTATTIWDAEFYVKVDDDVHLNIRELAKTLGRYRKKQRVYIGCMKTGPVLYQKGVRYHEPEFLKFGDEGNNYFRHASGQVYAISKDVATYISVNAPILHRYANEDVSLGSWLIGLDVDQVDERSMCCATPPDCEWKRRAGDVCVATFDWQCSGICNAAARMKDVHIACGEGDDTTWHND